MLIFSPWAFGTTQPWSIALMNAGGYLLGSLLLAKLITRKLARWHPPVWGDNRKHWTIVATAMLTVLILVYCLLSALNSRATFNLAERSFTYRESVRWLPHSYDSSASWDGLKVYLALALSFWAARDWLLTKSRGEQSSANLQSAGNPPQIPARLRRLLWVISLNGGLLAFEGLVQRTAGTNRLLWIVEPWINKSPEAQFGPYAYRSNGAQYLLLVWPVSLGFWSVLQKRSTTRGRSGHNNLLPCILIMAIAPLFSLSRAGAMIGSATIVVAALLLLGRQTQSRTKALLGTAGILAFALVLGIYIDWHRLAGRFAEASIDSNRGEIWRISWLVVKDFPLFGTGPGTFGSVYHLYRPSFDESWAGYAHNDWLEILMTFGAIGFAFVVGALALTLIGPSVAKRIPVPAAFCNLLYLALGACLLYAVVDFPFQIYSIAFIFVILCSVLTTISKRQSLRRNVALTTPDER